MAPSSQELEPPPNPEQFNAGLDDGFLVKFGTDGSKVWTKLIGSTGYESAYAVTNGLDGSLYVSGFTQSTTFEGQLNASTAGNRDGFITKFSTDGTKSWTSLIGSSGDESVGALITGSDGSVYLAGDTYGSTTLDGQTNAGNTDVFLTRFSADGTKGWTKVLGSILNEHASALTVGLDGAIYLAGYTKFSFEGQINAGGANSSDAFLTKFSPDGTKVWTRLIGSTNHDEAYGLTTGLDGSIYVAGVTLSTTLEGQANLGPLGTRDAFLTKFSPDGTKSWTKLIGSTSDDSASALTTGVFVSSKLTRPVS